VSNDAFRLAHDLKAAAVPLAAAADLDPLIERIAGSRFVLLGEASHGTSEFYTWRTEITKRLILERGFSFIAVEGDWPDCYRVNRYVRCFPAAAEGAEAALHAFERWPTWMWANREVVELASWLRRHNASCPDDRRVGFYGLDVYSLWDSIRAVDEYLRNVDPELGRAARRAYSCFDPYHEDAQEYARATALVPTSCEREAISVLASLVSRRERLAGDGREGFFDAEQNALVARNAELYYRTMVRGGATSWNVRDHHMVETLDRLVAHHGPDARAIVWEHNTHIGDARFTDMARHGMVNVGQLVRQAHADDGVVIVGFGTHRGSVIAADEWGEPMERMPVPPARGGSWEDACNRADAGDFLLVFDGTDDGGIPGLEEPWPHRAIGVVYDPRHERWGNYVPSLMASRYDAFIHVDESRAVDPLHMEPAPHQELPETYPSGM
jgi:erythromycin esterase